MASAVKFSSSRAILQNDFKQNLLSQIANFAQYEESNNRKAVLRFVPLDYLKEIAEARLLSCECQDDSRPVEVGDFFILELLRWFKEEFFNWMDKPSCPNCSGETVLLETKGIVTPEESRRSASRVEVYTCPKCCLGQKPREARFPRYSNPVVLLETRTGRCGEWANCFSLICREAGFEVRHVTDWTDHVWLEIYSPSQDRWMHCDPCENKLDTPLLYEIGWGKSLTYVIAVSHDDIQDVTWRYSHSKNHKTVLNRRNIVDEAWLVKTIVDLRKNCQKRSTPERIQELNRRLVKELVEFISPTEEGNAENLGGRESGSFAWRLARQEIRQEDTSGFVWKISKELISKCGEILEFFYDSVKDEIFINRSKEEVRKGYGGGAFEISNIYRKEEKDWNMVYLARNENRGGETGILAWKFEVSDLKIRSIQIMIPCAKFHTSASVTIEIISDSGKAIVIPESRYTDDFCKFHLHFDENIPTSSVIVRCSLNGGSGFIAWQQAQLFRESTELKSQLTIPEFPFVTLEIESVKN